MQIITGLGWEMAMPFILGVTIGFLGHYAVKWVKKCKTAASTGQGTIYIINHAKNGQEVKEIPFLEFKKHVTSEELNALIKSVGWFVRSDEVWQRVIEKSTHVVCFKKGGQLVGFGRFLGDGRMGIIYDVLVNPAYQREKIGTHIMNQLVRLINEKPTYTEISLFKWEENSTSSNFYERFGLEPSLIGMKCRKLNEVQL